MEESSSRLGSFVIGFAAYWPQFPGLRERLERNHRQVVDTQPQVPRNG